VAGSPFPVVTRRAKQSTRGADRWLSQSRDDGPFVGESETRDLVWSFLSVLR
jgi:hypothetical protein